MRYSVVAKTKGNVYISAPGSIQRGKFIFDLRTDGNNLLHEIAASIKVPDEKIPSMKTTVEPGKDDVIAKFEIGGDQELYDQLIEELQYLESDLSFATVGALQRIYWENPSSIEFIPENDEELELPTISSFSFSKSYRQPKALLSKKDLSSILDDTPSSKRLRIVKAFWRQGFENFNQFKYIQAFYSFYFVIEDFYAGGKTSEKQVLKQFSRSLEFKKISKIGLDSLLQIDRHKENLIAFFEEEGLEKNTKGLFGLLFRIRGNLHHYFSKSPRKHGTPFNQSDFESIALLVMHIATNCIQSNDPGLRDKKIKPIKPCTT